MKRKSIIYKKLSRKTGRFFYYSHKTKKRISKKLYYSKLKNQHTRRSQPKQKKSTSKKISREKVSGKYSKGFNLSIRTRLSIGQIGVEAIFEKTENFYQSLLKRRYKFNDNKIAGFNFHGRLVGGDFEDEGEGSFDRSTQGLLYGEFKELQYRERETLDTLNKLESLIGESKYKIDDVIITKIIFRLRDTAI